MKPIIYENSKVPIILSYLSPVSWFNLIVGKPIFKIWAITFGPLIFIRGAGNDSTIRHETIHAYQWMETYYIGFLILYVYDWILGLFKYKDAEVAYRMIRAEQEAYEFDSDEYYLEKRVPRKWIDFYNV